MKLLAHFLCLCLTLALTRADVLLHLPGDQPEDPHKHCIGHGPAPDRCEGLEMDAVTVSEDGVPYFFKGDYLFKGFHGLAEPYNQTFLQEHPVLHHFDAAANIQPEENPQAHGRILLFSKSQVFSFSQHKLEDGFPKEINLVFPGIPDHLDAAVECPKGDCDEDSIIFFKDDDIFHFDIRNKTVEEKHFDSMPNCTSAFRFMEHYYCFHGHMFSKFDPKTGDVHGKYPKEARDFFMKCSKFSNESDPVEREQCSRVHLDAITSDGAGHMFAFRGHHYLHRDENNDTLNAGLIGSLFKEVHSDVDAVFSYNNHLHMFKDDHVFLYKEGENHTLVDGYPKPMKDDMGFDGPVDAAFLCDDHVAHFVKGHNLFSVNMTNRVNIIERPVLAISHIDAAFCHQGGVKVIVGNHFFQYKSPTDLTLVVPVPEAHKVSMELFGCDH